MSTLISIMLLLLHFVSDCLSVVRMIFHDIESFLLHLIVPETCSNMFREIIESLFITHAETSLNTVGNVLNQDQNGDYYPLDNPWLIRGDEWCQGLVRRPQPKPTTTTTASSIVQSVS